jgi:dsDNA-specific endonuclease/ATPase MutS2
MATFIGGDRVHVPGVGTGTVREVRNGGRYLVAIKERTFVLDGSRLESVSPPHHQRSGTHVPQPPAADDLQRAHQKLDSLDLHGKTVAEAMEVLDRFLNDALLGSLEEVRVIHGRSGGRVKAAVHQRLRQLPSVRSFRVDPRNPGVTIVTF